MIGAGCGSCSAKWSGVQMTIVGSPASCLMFASRILRSKNEVTLVLLPRVTTLSGVSIGAGVASEEEEGLMVIVEMWKWGFVEVDARGSSLFMSLAIDKLGMSLPICFIGESRVFLPSLVSPFFPESCPQCKWVVPERNLGADGGAQFSRVA